MKKLISNTLGLCLLSVLLFSHHSVAAVTCDNENPSVPATTPTRDFVMDNNGTVVHKTTGLMWMRCAIGQVWDGVRCTGSAEFLQPSVALSASDGSGYGYTDWRIPNIKELASIREGRCYDPNLNGIIFPGIDLSLPFVSSSPVASGYGTGAGYWVQAFTSADDSRAEYDLYPGMVSMLLVRDANGAPAISSSSSSSVSSYASSSSSSVVAQPTDCGLIADEVILNDGLFTMNVASPIVTLNPEQNKILAIPFSTSNNANAVGRIGIATTSTTVGVERIAWISHCPGGEAVEPTNFCRGNGIESISLRFSLASRVAYCLLETNKTYYVNIRNINCSQSVGCPVHFQYNPY